jgi:hypothetical protein
MEEPELELNLGAFCCLTGLSSTGSIPDPPDTHCPWYPGASYPSNSSDTLNQSNLSDPSDAPEHSRQGRGFHGRSCRILFAVGEGSRS